MPAGSLLALIDDIASVLDDVALLTKVAAKKTAGVLGDDLALNAQQVAGVNADRELPVVWAVAKGSLRNKAILVPSALALSALAPWAVKPLLMLGGAYLCFEGVEKLVHKFFPGPHEPTEDSPNEAALAPLQLEQEKVKGAIRTDFILSAEIIVIALGTVAQAGFGTRVAVLTGVALLMTVGVYGLVAGIVKLDDLGLHLHQRIGGGRLTQAGRHLGSGLLWAAPVLMRFLSVAGTVAMFLVGGGILVHGLPRIGDWASAQGAVLAALTSLSLGLLAGGLVLAAVSGVATALRRLRGK